MRISFTFAQMQNYALSETRFQALYDLLRSYTGQPVGHPWTEHECMTYFEEELTKVSSLDAVGYDDGDQYVSIRGQLFSVRMQRHAYEVRTARQLLAKQLTDLHVGETHMVFVRHARKTFVELLDSVEF